MIYIVWDIADPFPWTHLYMVHGKGWLCMPDYNSTIAIGAHVRLYGLQHGILH